jgi:predicted metal-dependent hydrolase
LHIGAVTDERLWAGIRDFNAGRFFEAHEVWEDLWHGYRGSDRTFLQGLIQAAAGFYHLQTANPKGARSQLAKSGTKLRQYAPSHWGIDVDRLLQQLHGHLAALDQNPEDAPGDIQRTEIAIHAERTS